MRSTAVVLILKLLPSPSPSRVFVSLPVTASRVTCGTRQRGIEHPGDIAEAASLSSIPLPPPTYPLTDALGDDIVDTGKLSKLQLEGVSYACQKHCELLPDGTRAGFMIGDGAGVGKGRQISGIILDNYSRGRRRHLWISSSSDLHRDAERDLRDLGCHLKVINSCQELDREGNRALGLPKVWGGSGLRGCGARCCNCLTVPTRCCDLFGFVSHPGTRGYPRVQRSRLGTFSAQPPRHH